MGTWAKGLPRLVDLQIAADGNVYALTTDRLYRIEPGVDRFSSLSFQPSPARGEGDKVLADSAVGRANPS